MNGNAASDICRKEGATMEYPQRNRAETGGTVFVNMRILKGEMIGLSSISVTICVMVVQVCNNIQPCLFRREEYSNAVVSGCFRAIVVDSEC